jgi:eukaryotic-like serine/threonine-protein kinase
MPLAPGTRLGPYEILSELGTGGMGEVYRGKDTRLRRDVAIKTLHPSFLHDADRLRRFRQEAQSAALLDHPNILAVHFVGDDNGVPFLVCELLEGESLRERLRRELLPVRKSLDYAAQIIEGLAAAHEKGIIHRDLKPENIFLTKDGRAKILDFGLCKLIAESSATSEANSPTLTQGSAPGVVLGTVGYMSPEQIRGQLLDARSDIFSFGVVLYEMLAGKNTFRRSTVADTMSALLKEDPLDISESFPGISRGLDRVVRRALEKDPADRFQSLRDLGFALQAVTADSTAIRMPMSREPAARRTKHAAIGSLTGALLIAIVGAYFLGVHRSKSANFTQPEFQQLTFRRGAVRSARFAPDGKTVIYAASMDGFPVRLYLTRSDGPESHPIEHENIGLFAVSSSGELAIAQGCTNPGYARCIGTLARMPFSGGAPREVVSGVHAADWDPMGKEIAVDRREGGRFLVEFPIGKVIYATLAGFPTCAFRRTESMWRLPIILLSEMTQAMCWCWIEAGGQ